MSNIPMQVKESKITMGQDMHLLPDYILTNFIQDLSQKGEIFTFPLKFHQQNQAR